MATPRRAAKTGDIVVKGARVLVVETRYYDDIADELLAGASAVLNTAQARWDLVSVPGALEIPAAVAIALDAAEKRKQPYDGVVTLGCVIRGETSHYDIVAGKSARALMDMSVARRMPIGNAILTVNTEKQAWVRGGVKQHNKGGAAAEAALALIALKRGLAPKRGKR